jgi:hypothetical protein
VTQNTQEQPSSPNSKEIQVKGPHAQRRFLKPLAALQRALSTAGAPTDRAGPDSLPAEIFYKANGRTPMFMLQGLARVYEDLDIQNGLFSAIKLETKIIEDAFGALDFWRVAASRAGSWALPEAVVRTATTRYIEACGRAWAWLEARHWVAHRYQEEDLTLTASALAKKLRRVEWLSPRKESRALLRWFLRALRSTQEKLTKLDMSHIEHGLHEARRQIRWFSIYANALEGGVVLEPAPAPAGWEKYLQKEIVESPFNRLSPAEPEDAPIRIPAPLFYALSYAIDRLGVVKDRVQWTETMKHLLRATGEKTEKSLQELLGETYLEPQDAVKLAAGIVAEVFERDRLLPRLIEALEAQR